MWAVTALAQVDGGPGEEVLDRVVGAVEGRVITQAQLEFEARVLLVNAGAVKAAFAPLDAEVLAKSLTTIIDQRLLTLEADKLDTYPLEAGQLEQAVAAFRTRFANDAQYQQFLDAHEAEVSDLAQVLRRSIRAQRVLEGKLRLKAQVTDLEARQYAAVHPELKGVAVEQVRQRLFVQRFQSLAKEELLKERRQVDVRLLGPFAPPVRRSE